MTFVLCALSFTLGLITIDMFCDHYVFVAPSLTTAQVNTCTAFNRNVLEQPWYMTLAAAAPTLLGGILIFKNIKRSIYDMFSALLFLLASGIFIIQVQSSRTSLIQTAAVDIVAREGHLQQIAYGHATAGVLLFLLIILQLLAESSNKPAAKKKTA